jgi:hypothetical protein
MEPAPKVHAVSPRFGRSNDREVVAMSETLGLVRQWVVVRARPLGLFALAVILNGCASVSQDVDAYYRQMAYNYKEAEQKARMDAISLESESKVLAATGEMSKLRRTQRELKRVKSWEAKCDNESKRFEKAALWTEAHFHLQKPAIPDKPPGYHGAEDSAVQQAGGASDR